MLGQQNNAHGSLIVLKPVSRTKEGTEVNPYFQISRKNTDKWEIQDDQSISSVTGDLTKVEVAEEEYKGDSYFRVKFYLRDGDESYLIPFRFNISTRSLVNAILNLEEFTDVNISYFRSKSGYDTFAVKQNGNRVSWKYELDEIPSAKEVVFQKKKVKDYSDVDAFYVEKLQEFAEKLGKSTNAVSKSNVEETEVTDEVPF